MWGGPDTTALDTGRSRAELADRKNPHPAGFPLHEYTWKTAFLHSLVGRVKILIRASRSANWLWKPW
jgi:hypothetical protein